MLEEIRIRDLGVIEQAHLELGPGLTVLTGETGAGKTMVLTALGLVLGEKGDPLLVRNGAERAVCAARFVGLSDQEQRARDEHGADTSEGLVLARMLTSEGRSRSLLGGASVPASTLSTLGEELISIHGQGSTSRLLRRASQRALLDQFGNLNEDVALHRDLFAQVRDLDARIAELTGDRRDAQIEAEALRELIAAVEKVQPKVGEISELKTQIERLAHADALLSAARAAHEAIAGSETADALPSVLSLLALARRAVESQRDVDATIAGLADEVLELAVRGEELSADLARYLESFDFDSSHLEDVHTRLAELQSTLRRFDLGVDDQGIEVLLDRYSSAGLRLLDIDGGDERLAQLEAERADLVHERDQIADRLTLNRRSASAALGEVVTAEIASLAMAHTRFIVRVGDADHGPYGRDDVEFLLQVGSNAGVPVAKGASGGELSRVMLALEVVLAQSQSIGTRVFDEVDAGVGGAAAIEVGRRLQRLARHAQVIVVTHLAQVAAFADAHFTVTKDSDGQITSSSVVLLDRTERVAELARMMAGLAESERAQASGEELLALADASRA